METPRFEHIDKSDFNHVYEPSEDSFLLIDALEIDMKFIADRRPLTCLEVGSGSGVVITALKMAFPQSFCFATDINTKACLITKDTAKNNNVDVECINMDLISCFDALKFDLIMFNPPYVVTGSSEVGSRGIEASWAGGLKGREVIDRLLPDISKKLTINGVFYMLVIDENIPEEIVSIMEEIGFESEVIIKRTIRNERQSVLKFVKKIMLH